MSGIDVENERASARLRRRLWGAAVLIAIAVIVLPLLFDGAGSESQFRRVERLREEPPRILGEGERGERTESASEPEPTGASAAAPPDATVEGRPRAPGLDIRIGEDDPPDYLREAATGAATVPTVAPEAPRRALSAWVVQAGSFRERDNALAVRDRLRRAGYPSFVTEASAGEGGETIHRVQVGPMVDRERAAETRRAVIALLGREALVVAYP